MANKTNWEILRPTLEKNGVLPVDNVPKNIINYLNNNKSSIPKNEHLAGQIQNEYDYTDWPNFIDSFLLQQIGHPILTQWSSRMKSLSSDKPFYLSSLWINLQKKYEFNPMHDHSGVFSFIIFLKIPYNLDDEDKVFPKSSIGSSCGRLCFIVNDYMGDIFDIRLDVDKSFENKMLMFPAKMPHLVYPFYTSDEYRITVSGNIALNVD